jgi:hypothetical protein
MENYGIGKLLFVFPSGINASEDKISLIERKILSLQQEIVEILELNAEETTVIAGIDDSATNTFDTDKSAIKKYLPLLGIPSDIIGMTAKFKSKVGVKRKRFIKAKIVGVEICRRFLLSLKIEMRIPRNKNIILEELICYFSNNVGGYNPNKQNGKLDWKAIFEVKRSGIDDSTIFEYLKGVEFE